RLDQSPAVVKKPGESVKISCKISGFSMTSSYMQWIRQKPGKALEWIGMMDAGKNDVTYAKSFKNHFTMTEDVSASTQYLEAKSLRTEDNVWVVLSMYGWFCSIVYSVYCVRYHHVFSSTDVHGEELTQPASMTVQPGQSLSINCKVSYSVTSYNTHWIRQPAGKLWSGLGTWVMMGAQVTVTN
ncbi:hypothetical protein HF521_004912, partial [Silurus meridionalis]